MKTNTTLAYLLLFCPSLAFSDAPLQVLKRLYLPKFESEAKTPKEMQGVNSSPSFVSAIDDVKARATLIDFFAPSFKSENALDIVSDPWSDLELFSSEKGHLLNQVFESQTLFGEVYAALSLVFDPSSAASTIQARQSMLKHLAHNKARLEQIAQALASIRGLERPLLDLYDTRHPLNSEYMTILYQDETAELFKESTRARNRNPAQLGYEFVTTHYVAFLLAMPLNIKLFQMMWNYISSPYMRGIFALWQVYTTQSTLRAPFENHYNYKTLNSFLVTTLHQVGKFLLSVAQIHELDPKLPQGLRLNLTLEQQIQIKVLHQQIQTLTAPDNDGHFFQLNLGRAAAASRLLMEMRASLLVELMRKIGAIDFYSAVARRLSNEKGGFCFARLVDEGPFVQATSLWNPLLPQSVAVSNDVQLGNGAPRNFVITGHNASGKSTYMRALGIGIYFSQLLGVAPAKEMTFVPFKSFNTFMKNTDAVGERSSFQTEVEANRRVMNLYKDMRSTDASFMISDEPFKSTNMEDATAASKIVFQFLCKRPQVMFVVATHLEDLTTFVGTDACGLANKHMQAIEDNGETRYTYQIVDGVSPSTNALTLLRKKLQEK